MVWLATDLCNARCHHCSSASTKRSPDELRTEEVEDLFRQMVELGVLDLAVSGGEPLLRPDLLGVLEHARSLGLRVGVGSNGSVLNRDAAKELARVGVHRVQVSLDGLPEQHDELRAWPGLFNRAVRAIGDALEAGLRTHVCCTIHRENADVLEELATRVASLGVARINFSRFVPTGRGDASLDVSDEAWRAIVHRVAAIKRAMSGTIEVTTHLAQSVLADPELASMPGFVGCQAGVGQGCVTANGTVTPCVLLPIPLGNVRSAPLAEIWNDAPANRALRERSRLEGRCGACAHRDRCGGCRAVALARTGNYLAEDPRCWC